MNSCNEKYFKKNMIDFEKIDSNVYNMASINSITSTFGLDSIKIFDRISIANIVGIDRFDNFTKKFPGILDSYFDANGDSYHSRAVGMLDYDENNIIEKLTPSFHSEPICIHEVDKEKYVISTNGIHRFCVLRALFLKEMSKASNQNEVDDLIKKYTIPVKVTKLDYIKTYCKYLINLLQSVKLGFELENIVKTENTDGTINYKITLKKYGGYSYNITSTEEDVQLILNSITRISNEYDENYNLTGKATLRSLMSNEEKTLSNDELIEFTRKKILEIDKNNLNEFLINLYKDSKKYESLRQFIQTYFSDLIDLNKGEVLVSQENESNPFGLI